MDRLCTHSDMTVVRAHRKSGLLADRSATRRGASNKPRDGGDAASDDDDLVRVRLPTAFRLMIQELASCNVTVRLRFKHPS